MDEHYNDIDTLIAKFLAGEASPEEAMQLDDWMNLSPVNRATFEQAQVADGLGDRGLGVGDRVGVIANELIEHLLRVLGLVEERIDVRADEGRDPTEDGLLGHAGFPS